MGLELLNQQPEEPTHSAPLLFVHGAWHGAWCWQEHFVPYFAEAGFGAYALSLRGHGGSTTDKPLGRVRLRDYVADLVQAVDMLPRPPILIGHSMGGMVVQNYLQRFPAAGAVFLASVPPFGAITSTLRVTRRFPRAVLKAALTWSLYPVIATPAQARALLFSSEFPEELLKVVHSRLQEESFFALVDMLLEGLGPAPSRHRIPTLVVGSDADAMIPLSAVHATARVFGTAAVVLPGLGHDMMLEPRWRDVASRILEWLKEEKL